METIATGMIGTAVLLCAPYALELIFTYIPGLGPTLSQWTTNIQDKEPHRRNTVSTMRY